MGPKGLLSMCENVKKRHSWEDFRGKIIVMDVMYQLNRMSKSKYHNNINHVYNFLKVICRYLSIGIIPLPVFDGKVRKEKMKTVNYRRTKMNKMNEINDTKNSVITGLDIIACKQLLDHMKLSYIESNGEADSLCVKIANHYSDSIAGIFSKDADMLIFGCKTMIYESTEQKDELISIDRDEVIDYFNSRSENIRRENKLEPLIFTFNNLVEYSLLLGTDYRNVNDQNCSIKGLDKNTLFEIFVLADYDACKMVKFIKSDNETDEIVYKIKKKLENRTFSISEEFDSVFEETKQIYMENSDVDVDTVELLKISDENFNVDTTELYSFLLLNHVTKSKDVIQFVSHLSNMYNSILHYIT